MMKNVTAAIVLCLMSASAFAAAPAFDSPEQEAAHYQQERARQAFEERYDNQTASENASYYAVPAFGLAGAGSGLLPAGTGKTCFCRTI